MDRSSISLDSSYSPRLAAEHEAQVWIERVGDQDVGAVVLEDGHLRDVS